MKTKNSLLLTWICLCISGIASAADSTSLGIVKSFVSDLSNGQVAYEAIISTYLRNEVHAEQGSVQKEEQEAITTLFNAFRKELKADSSWVIEAYLTIPEKSRKILTADNEKKNFYRLRFGLHHQHTTFIWVKGGKIRSLTTMKKGDLEIPLEMVK